MDPSGWHVTLIIVTHAPPPGDYSAATRYHLQTRSLTGSVGALDWVPKARLVWGGDALIISLATVTKYLAKQPKG